MVHLQMGRECRRGLMLISRAFLLFLVVTQLSSCVIAGENEEGAVKSVIVTQAKAWNEGDIDKFMAGYWNSDELTFCSGGKTTRGYQKTLERYKLKYDSPGKMGKLTFSDLEVTLLGDEAALVLGRWRLKRKVDEPNGNFSLVFRKIGGQWLIVHDHSSALVAP